MSQAKKYFYMLFLEGGGRKNFKERVGEKGA